MIKVVFDKNQSSIIRSHNLLTVSDITNQSSLLINQNNQSVFTVATKRMYYGTIILFVLIFGVGSTFFQSAYAAEPSGYDQFENSDDHIICEEPCDDIDAVVDEDALESEDTADEVTEDLVEGRNTDTNHFLKSQNGGNELSELNLTPYKVPLNAISPKIIATFVEVIDTIRQDYLKPVNDEVLFQYAIQGMLEKLDPYAEYLTSDKFEKLRNFTDGEIGQVGLTAKFDSLNDVWVIDKVLPRSSANDAGIQVGQKLLRIKKIELTENMRADDIEQLLQGIAGSQVQVTIVDKLGKKKDVLLQRNLSAVNKLEVTIRNTIAIVKLPIFQNSTREQIINALREEGIPITGIVIDVRNNPGGVLSSAIDTASLFVADKDLIQVRSRGNKNQLIRANGRPLLSDIPIVILQNKYTASAAEVLSSSLQTNDLATIIGEKSYGKGTVQEVVPLKSGGGLKLTVAEYRSAKGSVIDGQGIQPDIYLTGNGNDWIDQSISILLATERPIAIMFDGKKGLVSISNDY